MVCLFYGFEFIVVLPVLLAAKNKEGIEKWKN